MKGVLLRLCILVAAMLPAGAALAANAGDKGDWFKGLKQPGTGLPCCDISDCRRTEAEWRSGQWWAIVRGEWTPIPRRREVHVQSFDGEAYVCTSQKRLPPSIYCFVPPILGM
jgi:hypothetical protein